MTVQVTVKLYGTLGRWAPGYDPETGFAVQMGRLSTIADLIDRLGIPARSVGMVSVNGRVTNQFDLLPDQGLVNVFHPIFGG